MGARLAEEDEEESSFGPGKAVLVILAMFAVGVVAGFGYFHLSTPPVHTGGNNNQQQQNSTPAAGTPSTTPAATATGTPHAEVRPSETTNAQAYAIVVRSAM